MLKDPVPFLLKNQTSVLYAAVHGTIVGPCGPFLFMVYAPARQQRTGKVFVTAAFGLLGLLGYEQVSDLLARPLEAQYPSLTQMEVEQGVKWIVVLGGKGREAGIRSQG